MFCFFHYVSCLSSFIIIIIIIIIVIIIIIIHKGKVTPDILLSSTTLSILMNYSSTVCMFFVLSLCVFYCPLLFPCMLCCFRYWPFEFMQYVNKE